MEEAKGKTKALPKLNKPAPTKTPPAPSTPHLMPYPTVALTAAVACPPPSDAHEVAHVALLPTSGNLKNAFTHLYNLVQVMKAHKVQSWKARSDFEKVVFFFCSTSWKVVESSQITFSLSLAHHLFQMNYIFQFSRCVLSVLCEQ
jgi:hypothetical protein